MIDFQTIAAVVFLVVLTAVLYAKRKSLDTKFLVPYLIYFSMYRGKWGLKLMDSVAKRFRRLSLFLGYAGVVIGFLGMAFICYALIDNIYALFTKPQIAQGVGLVLPVKAKGVFYVPFFYWIISIFAIALVHEFSHGLIARVHNLKVKSSGFAFLGFVIPIIPAAFVEPDEKELRKRPHRQQLSVFAAGPLANIIFGFLFLLALMLFLTTVAPIEGVKIADYTRGEVPLPVENAGIKIGEVIYEVDNIPTPYLDNLTAILRAKNPGDIARIKTDKAAYTLELAEDPQNKSRGIIGASLEQNVRIKYEIINKNPLLVDSLFWLIGLFYWLYILNLGIGLFNLVPVGPLDGGRMLQLALHRIFDKKKGDKVWFYIGIFFTVIILANVLFGFFK